MRAGADPRGRARRRGEVALAALLLATFALRTFVVQAHLAAEEHIGVGGSAHLHAVEEGELAPPRHSHGARGAHETHGAHTHASARDPHDHEDDAPHAPHPATDHVLELVAPRAPSPTKVVAPAAILPMRVSAEAPRLVVRSAPAPDSPGHDAATLEARLARGPPRRF